MSYIRITVYSIECDVCAEVARDYVRQVGDVQPLRSARAAIARDGWSHLGHSDFCPEHTVDRRGGSDEH